MSHRYDIHPMEARTEQRDTIMQSMFSAFDVTVSLRRQMEATVRTVDTNLKDLEAELYYVKQQKVKLEVDKCTLEERVKELEEKLKDYMDAHDYMNSWANEKLDKIEALEMGLRAASTLISAQQFTARSESSDANRASSADDAQSANEGSVVGWQVLTNPDNGLRIQLIRKKTTPESSQAAPSEQEPVAGPSGLQQAAASSDRQLVPTTSGKRPVGRPRAPARKSRRSV